MTQKHYIFLPLFLALLLRTYSSAEQHSKLFIVYLGEHRGELAAHEIEDHHHSFLFPIKESTEKARKSLLYSYKNSINGFAAFLSEEEAAKISEMEGVISTFPSEGRSAPQTTRSWEFIGVEDELHAYKMDSLPPKANYGKDIIVGMLDSGIWPESRSFSDTGMGPVPKHWKGICEEGDSFNSSNCNRKLIGARSYVKGYEAYYGRLNTSYAYRSARDHDGHGTHTASTVAGRPVAGVSSRGGFAAGTATGGAPLARLAVYKVCWPIPGPNPNLENTCFDADMLAAIDDAIADGVDVLSISIGDKGKARKFLNDSIAIGTLHAVKKEVVAVCSAGNRGPGPATGSNLAPWMITVGASSIDREFNAPLTLGNGKIIMGQTATPDNLKKRKQYPLVYSGDVEVPNTPQNVSGQCLPNSLASDKVEGKVVLCFRGTGMRVEKGLEVKRAGGAAMILGNRVDNDDEIPVDSHLVPATAVSWNQANEILTYIKSVMKPTVALAKGTTVVGLQPAPAMAAFSSRGPNSVEPNLLKPDVTAPGLNILAAWSEASSQTKLDVDNRGGVKYNLLSGTSMSCPHVSAVAALLKSIYPHWTSSAIRSAIMTTATVNNAQGQPMADAAGGLAGPMAFGSGHIRPAHALDPGLVYDASYVDYLLFACASIGSSMDPSFSCPENPPTPSNLNYPSVAVAVPSNGTITVRRTVTNVGPSPVQYEVTVVDTLGFSVQVQPKTLRFTTLGEKKSFLITISAKTKGAAGFEAYETGSLTWSDGTHEVRSPIVVHITC